MAEFSFEALGTPWVIVTDDGVLTEKEQKVILSFIQSFEQQFSRFLPDSEAVRFRTASKGEYEISEELADMLQAGAKLCALTNGGYNPALGELLEHTGYDADYRFTPNQEAIINYQVPDWSVVGRTLFLEKGAVFDVGGIGKGFCIDKVVKLLQTLGHQHFLVDAGGDMYGTSKQDGSPFQVALEWPGKPGTVFGTVALFRSGLAVSDSFRRRWSVSAKVDREEQNWHHIIHPLTKKPVQKVVGCTAIAKNAFFADCITSGIFLASGDDYVSIAKEFAGEFVVFLEDGTAQISSHWPGEFFEKEEK